MRSIQITLLTILLLLQIGARVPQGSAVDVYYDPDNPSAAVIDRKLHGIWLVWLLAAGLLFGSIWSLTHR